MKEAQFSILDGESVSGEKLGAWSRLSRRPISSGLERRSHIREVTEAL